MLVSIFVWDCKKKPLLISAHGLVPSTITLRCKACSSSPLPQLTLEEEGLVTTFRCIHLTLHPSSPLCHRASAVTVILQEAQQCNKMGSSCLGCLDQSET